MPVNIKNKNTLKYEDLDENDKILYNYTIND